MQIYQSFNHVFLDEFTQLSEAGPTTDVAAVTDKFSCIPDRYEYYKAKSASIEFVRNQKVCML